MGSPSDFYAWWSLRSTELGPLLLHLLKDVPPEVTTFRVHHRTISPSLLGCFQLLYKHAGNKTKPILIANPTLATTPFLYLSFFLELPSISLLVPLDPKTDLAKDVTVEIGQMVTKLFPLPGHTNKWCFPVSLHLNETMWLVLAIGMWVRVMCQLQAEAFEYGSTPYDWPFPFQGDPGGNTPKMERVWLP